MPKRTITLEITSDLTQEQYADLANTMWMLMRSTGHAFWLYPDDSADLAVMNDAWEQYGLDSSWGRR